MSVFARGVLVSCIGVGFTACSETRQNLNAPHANAWQAKPANKAASYVPYSRPNAPHVLMAQNNHPPALRGSSQIRKAILQQYHIDDSRGLYSPNAQPIAAKNISSGYTSAPAITAAPKPHFQHQLEDAAPNTARASAAKNYQSPAQNYHTETAVYANQAALPYQSVSSQSYDAQTAASIEQPSPKTDFQPAYQGSGTSINQSLQTALKQSSRLAIEDIKIQEAEEQLEQAKAQGRFKLNLEGAVGANQSEIDFRAIDRSESDFRVSRDAGLNLSLPIYQGGRINAQKDVAKVDIQTAKANYQAVETHVTEQAGIAHLDVLRDRALIEVYKRNVALLQSQKETVQALLRAGENTVTDEALVDARLASIHASLKQAQSNLSSSESRYKKLTGFAAPALAPVQEFTLPSSLQAAKDAAFSNNSQLQAMKSQSEAAYHNIKLAKSLARPKLALQGRLRASEGQSDTIRRASAAEVLLNLSMPILSGGENKSRVRQAALAQSRSALETRALQEDLSERIEQLWASVSAAKESQGLNLAQRNAAKKAYQAIILQRKAGVATSLDVLSVEQTLLDAELNMIQAENTEGVARLQILGLMGAL